MQITTGSAGLILVLIAGAALVVAAVVAVIVAMRESDAAESDGE